jgi:hypothetical protein
MNATLSQIKLRKYFSWAKFFQKCKLMHSYLGEDFMMQKWVLHGSRIFTI